MHNNQKIIGINSEWITEKDIEKNNYKNYVLNNIRNLNTHIIHVHGLWRSSSRIYKLYLKENIPYIIAPHGMLDQWALNQSKLKKKIYWSIIEKWSIKSSKCIHALCKSEVDSIKNLGIKNNIALIPNGVQIINKNQLKNLPRPPWENIIPEKSRILLFFGRYHKKKGIKELLESWKIFSDKHFNTNWWLVFIGYGKDTNPKEVIKKNNIKNCISLDAVFNNKLKASSYLNSEAFILPSYSEGLPMAVLEAMSFSKASFITKECNLNDAFDKKAAIEITSDKYDIANTLEKYLIYNNQELNNFGENAFEFVKENYSWEKVSLMTEILYNWVNGQGDKPPFIVT